MGRPSIQGPGVTRGQVVKWGHFMRQELQVWGAHCALRPSPVETVLTTEGHRGVQQVQVRPRPPLPE